MTLTSVHELTLRFFAGGVIGGRSVQSLKYRKTVRGDRFKISNLVSEALYSREWMNHKFKSDRFYFSAIICIY